MKDTSGSTSGVSRRLGICQVPEERTLDDQSYHWTGGSEGWARNIFSGAKPHILDAHSRQTSKENQAIDFLPVPE